MKPSVLSQFNRAYDGEVILHLTSGKEIRGTMKVREDYVAITSPNSGQVTFINAQYIESITTEVEEGG